MELASSHKHIKSTSTCGTILTENELETGTWTPVQPRLKKWSAHNWVGREEKWSDQDLCPWEETQRKRERVTQADTCLAEWAVQATDWMRQLRVQCGGDKPRCLVGELLRRAVRSTDSTLEEHVLAGSPLRQGRERYDLVAARFPGTAWRPTPTQAEQMLRVRVDLGQPWLSERLNYGTQRQRGPREEPGWGGSGHCWRSLKQSPRSSPHLWQQLLYHSSPPDTCQEAMWAPPTRQSDSTAGRGWQRLGAVIGCEG